MLPFKELRHLRLREGIQFQQDRCMEIGALIDPILKQEDGQIFYADRLSLKDIKQQFSWDKNLQSHQFVTIDYVLEKERSLKECVEGTFDYIIASHVAEHVPNLIGWIEEIREVLNPLGQLRLTLPDGRYSFDMKRQDTRLSDLLAEWMKKSYCPDTHLVLDFALNKVSEHDVAQVHLQHGLYPDKNELQSQFPFSEVLEWGQRTLDPNHYEDVHCWVLHLNLFAKYMTILAENDLLKMACVKWYDIDPSTSNYEFSVFLSPEEDRLKRIESWKEVYQQTRQACPSVSLQQYQALEQKNAKLKQQIDALYHSHSWRITEPFRRFMTLMKSYCYRKL